MFLRRNLPTLSLLLICFTPTTNAFSMPSPKPIVAVVGSANQDLTSYTAVLPKMGETVTGMRFETSSGGKGANQARAAAATTKAADADVHFLGRVGPDVFGRDLLEQLQQQGVLVDESTITLQDKSVSTGVASIVVDTSTGDNSIIVTPGANHVFSADDVRAGLQALPQPPATVVAQLEICQAAAAAALETGRALGATTLLNPAPAPEAGILDDLYPHVDILIPNETELRKLCGVQEDDDTVSEEDLAHQLLNKGVRKAVICTLGARGALVVAKTDELSPSKVTYVAQPDDLPCKNDPIEDTIGAGDGFCGALATYLATGAVELETAAGLACGLASMSVRLRGAQYPSSLPDCLKLPAPAPTEAA